MCVLSSRSHYWKSPHRRPLGCSAQSSALAAPSSILCTLVPLFFLLSLAVGSFFFGLKLKLAQKRASLSLHPALYSFCCWPSKRLAITTDDILLPLVSSTPRLLTSPFPLFPIPTLRTTKRVTLRQKRSPHLLPSPLALVNT